MTLDLMDLAPRGDYLGAQLVGAHNTRNGSMLPFNGSPGDARGFVIDSRSKLEDGSTKRVLRMHPKWVDNGTIKGWLPWARLPDDAVFEAEVGFLDGAQGTDGVSFQVWAHRVHDGRVTWTRVGRLTKPYTGRLSRIRADLGFLSGQNVRLELRVDAGRSSGQDWAAWVAPRVVSSTTPGTMPVTIEMNRFTVLNADEDSWFSNGDEPYLLPMNIFADGHSIKLSDIRNATVRIMSPRRTHGNLGGGHMDAGDSRVVPASTGRVETTMMPVAGIGNLGRQLAIAGLAVIFMEEDATPTSAVDAGRRTMVRETRNELASLVQNLQAPSESDIQQLVARVRNKVVDTIKKETLSSITGIFSVFDPDDFIDSEFVQWTYQDIQQAGASGIPFSWTASKSGVRYTLNGRVVNA